MNTVEGIMEELLNNQEWYKDIPYEEKKKFIHTNIENMSRSFIAIGYYLKDIRDKKEYLVDGYESIWEFAEDIYGIKMSTASRWMSMNDKFSKDGNSPVIADRYKEFGKSHLQEMLALPEEDYKMITPEATKEDIRELARFNKENENNPARLTNWQQSDDETLENAVIELFHERKDALNELYSSKAYEENDMEAMKKIIYTKSKKSFKTKDRSVFFFLYETNVYVKDCSGNEQDITWEEFMEIIKKVFDSSAAGNKTWEEFYEPKKETDPEEEQIPGQDNILNHPEYMPAPKGILHGKKFVKCIYQTEIECISEDCEQCEKKKEHEKAKKDTQKLLEAEATAIFAEHNPQKLKKIMEICRNNAPEERAKAVQMQFAPYGYSGCTYGNYSESWHGFQKGIQITWDGKQVLMKYGRLVEELLKLYNPYSEEFMTKEVIAPAQKKSCIHRPEFPCTLSHAQMLAAGDGEDCNSKCCWNCSKHGQCGYECNSSAHRPDEVIESAAVEIDNEEENSSIPEEWPRELFDIPIPPIVVARNILRKQEETLKMFMEECDGIPYETLMKEQLITGGLRLIYNLVCDIQEKEYE